MEANKFDGWPSSSFLTLLIWLQCSDNDTGGGDVSRIILYEPGGKVDLISVVFSRYLSCIPIAIKILLEAMNVQFLVWPVLNLKFGVVPSLVFVVRQIPWFLY